MVTDDNEVTWLGLGRGPLGLDGVILLNSGVVLSGPLPLCRWPESGGRAYVDFETPVRATPDGG